MEIWPGSLNEAELFHVALETAVGFPSTGHAHSFGSLETALNKTMAATALQKVLIVLAPSGAVGDLYRNVPKDGPLMCT